MKSKDISIDDIYVKYQSKELPLSKENNPESFHQEINGTIEAFQEDDEMSPIGYFKIYVFNLDRTDNQPDYFETFDSVSEETYEYYHDLFEDPYHLKDKILDNFYSNFTQDCQDNEDMLLKEDFENNYRLIIFSSMQIIEKYRGNNIGLAVIKKMWGILKNERSILTLKPCPLHDFPKKEEIYEKLQELANKMHYDKFVTDEKKGKRKLLKYWSKLGLERIGKNGICFTSNPNFSEIKNKIKLDIIVSEKEEQPQSTEINQIRK